MAGHPLTDHNVVMMSTPASTKATATIIATAHNPPPPLPQHHSSTTATPSVVPSQQRLQCAKPTCPAIVPAIAWCRRRHRHHNRYHHNHHHHHHYNRQAASNAATGCTVVRVCCQLARPSCPPPSHGVNAACQHHSHSQHCHQDTHHKHHLYVCRAPPHVHCVAHSVPQTRYSSSAKTQAIRCPASPLSPPPLPSLPPAQPHT